MKILFVTFLYEPSLGGGASQVVHSLANGLSAQGHEVLVVSPEGLLQGWIGKLAENRSLIMLRSILIKLHLHMNDEE
ncbi:MAG: glycogen/starch synthase [Anaerolineaceae bacterium]